MTDRAVPDSQLPESQEPIILKARRYTGLAFGVVDDQVTVTYVHQVPQHDRYLRRHPLTMFKAAYDRKFARQIQAKLDGVKIESYTCDDCGLVRRCLLAFDVLNVAGFCLLE